MRTNLKKLRNNKGLSLRELDSKVNINYSQLARIERGESSLTHQHIEVLTDFFGVSADYLLGLPSKAISFNDGTFKSVKIVGSICAGDPNFMEDSFLGYLPAKVDNADDYFYLEVSGDFMSPTFLDGDYVLIKFQQTANNNDVVVAGINGHEATVKRYKEIGHEKFLFPDNEEYEALKLIPEDEPYIIGIVEGFFRPKI